MEKNSPLKLGPMALAAAPGVIKGIAGLAGGLIGSRKRRREPVSYTHLTLPTKA